MSTPSNPAARGPDEDPEIDGPESGEAEAGEASASEAAPDADPEAAPEVDPEAAPEVEEETPEFADLPLPTLDALRAALDWAFTEEEVPAGYLDRCAEHALLVQTANRRMNLTKIVEPRDIAAKHYLDCWRAARFLPLVGRSMLDLGSGAGYPGVPIALAEPHASIALIDSVQKKADFLAESIEKLGLPNVKTFGERAEDHLQRHHYEVVILRAVSSVRENVRTLRKVGHSLRDLVMMKGPSWSREVRAGEREAERLGFKLDTVWEYSLPEELGQRAVLVYRAPGGQGR
jgi:16S rRNA (guanine527-N7)-methyltransferase